jgi:hypothetical protein
MAHFMNFGTSAFEALLGLYRNELLFFFERSDVWLKACQLFYEERFVFTNI